MKTKFATRAMVIILAVGTVLAGCGKKAAAEVDVSAVAQALNEGLSFKDEMNEVPESRINDYYPTLDASTLESFKMYKGASGGTAEELAVFKAKDADAAEAVKKAVAMRLEDLKLQFEAYVPAEVKKIENAVTKTSGNYTVVVVADDFAAAQKLVDKKLS
ncbi:MAG: DUF4358 domain-containing protein [Hydrogenoanaerobacterium sp.]